MNLFGNSCKYTARGFILVRLRMEDVPGSKDPGEKMLVLNVIDTGKGMSSDYLERRLFTPFSQEDPFASGVGLGLSIV
jgi:signal transduction histidine kinase